MTGAESGYSAVASQQLDHMKESGRPDMYAATVETCEFILDEPGLARRSSAAIKTGQGIRFRTPVRRFPDIKIFWSAEGPRIEAVFPYPT